MRDHVLIIAALLTLYGLWLTYESLRARRDRAKLRHVIYVNGTRGKTTVTRMIHAGLTGLGYRVLCKTTGTLPLCIHVDGREEVIRRHAPANIREQLTYLHKAAQEGAEILVMECMALDPMLQRVSAHRMLGCDVAVITNARLDHTDVMGETRQEILDCLMEIIPKNGLVCTAERDLFPRIQARCAQRGCRVELALPEQAAGWESLDFADNTALALCVCKALTGRGEEDILRGIGQVRRDPFSLEIYQQGAVRLVNALSANDSDSTRIILDRCRGSQEERLVLLINNRADRPARARDMARLCGVLEPAEVWLLGESLGALARLCRRQAPRALVRRFDTVGQLPLDGQEPTLILAVGNIKNEGMSLVERARQEMTLMPDTRR